MVWRLKTVARIRFIQAVVRICVTIFELSTIIFLENLYFENVKNNMIFPWNEKHDKKLSNETMKIVQNKCFCPNL